MLDHVLDPVLVTLPHCLPIFITSMLYCHVKATLQGDAMGLDLA